MARVNVCPPASDWPPSPRFVVLACRNVTRQGRRSLVMLGAVGFGVVALIVAGGFIGWILSEMRDLSIRTWFGHVTVARTGYWEQGRAQPDRFLVAREPQAVASLRADRRVLAVAPRVNFAALASAGDTTLSFVGEGVDPEQEARFGRSLIFLPGRGANLAPGDSDGAVVGQGLAANLGVKTGDRLVLLATAATGGVSAAEVTVRGVFLTANKGFDDSTLRVPLGVAQRLLKTTGVHAWTVLLADSSDTRSVTEELQQAGVAERLEARPWTMLATTYLRTEALFGAQMAAVAIVLGLLIVLGISNTMTMNVMERTSEIGTAMALGATRRGILAQFMAEGAALGAVGGIAGAVIGVGLALLLSWVGIPLPPPPGLDTPIIAEIRVDSILVLEAFLVVLASTVLASVYPAIRASRLVIVDALRRAHV